MNPNETESAIRWWAERCAREEAQDKPAMLAIAITSESSIQNRIESIRNAGNLNTILAEYRRERNLKGE
jgi:hypothetical protein